MDNAMTVLLHIALGASLASCAGLRAFFPLFLVGFASRLGHLPLNESFTWLASTPALITFGSASVLELLADKLPALDHALDTIGTVVRPVAGVVAASCILYKMPPLYAIGVGIIVGAPLSAGFTFLKGSARALSSLLTMGTLNPLLSVLEDLTVVSLSILALALPIITCGILVILAVTLSRLLRRADALRKCRDPLSPQ